MLCCAVQTARKISVAKFRAGKVSVTTWCGNQNGVELSSLPALYAVAHWLLSSTVCRVVLCACISVRRCTPLAGWRADHHRCCRTWNRHPSDRQRHQLRLPSQTRAVCAQVGGANKRPFLNCVCWCFCMPVKLFFVCGNSCMTLLDVPTTTTRVVCAQVGVCWDTSRVQRVERQLFSTIFLLSPAPPPSPPIVHIHHALYRCGRAARAGRPGSALSLLTRDELPYLLDLHLFLSRQLAPAPLTPEQELVASAAAAMAAAGGLVAAAAAAGVSGVCRVAGCVVGVGSKHCRLGG